MASLRCFSCTSIDGASCLASSSLSSTHPLVRSLGDVLACYTGSPTITACPILAGSVLTVALALGDAIVPQLKFVWRCFLRPLGATDQRTCLDGVRSLPSASLFALSLRSQFYKGQADVYDTTRPAPRRNTMLRLSASHLRTLRAEDPSQRLVWVRHWWWYWCVRFFPFICTGTHHDQVTTSRSWTRTIPSLRSTPSASSISVNLSWRSLAKMVHSQGVA